VTEGEIMSNYTQGDWQFWESRDLSPHQIFISKQIGCILVPHHGYIDPDKLISSQQLANARLMSTSPKLLAALDHAVSIAEDQIAGNWDDVMKYRDLIRLATGKKNAQ